MRCWRLATRYSRRNVSAPCTICVVGGGPCCSCPTTWRRSRIYARAACGSQRAESSSTDRCVKSLKPTWDRLLQPTAPPRRSEEHTSELQSQSNLVCRLLLEKKNKL